MNINPVEVIKKKRDGERLSAAEIKAFVSGAVQGTIPEYQITALLMATYFSGMDLVETSELTRAMIDSGSKVSFDDGAPKVDKHSTGGVGDKISIVLLPLVAACGVDVPMVAGRGLGHTGGTLDKLESIPGFRVRFSIEEFKRLVSESGMSLMGQTDDFVPADKLLYALRDVTATVDCIPLITASILSKKVAEGISGLVLDIKVGSGAFMRTQREAERLAKTLVDVGGKLGLEVRAVLTDMNQPLGLAVGHSLEILECIDVLEGKGPSDVRDLTIELAAHMLILGEKASSIAAARTLAKRTLASGAALDKFRELCRIQGALFDVTKDRHKLEVAKSSFEVLSARNGSVTAIDGQALGMSLIRIGGGRMKATDRVDHSVGFVMNAKLGTKVEKGSVLMRVHYSPEKLKAEGLSIGDLQKELLAAFSISSTKTKPSALIKKVIS